MSTMLCRRVKGGNGLVYEVDCDCWSLRTYGQCDHIISLLKVMFETKPHARFVFPRLKDGPRIVGLTDRQRSVIEQALADGAPESLRNAARRIMARLSRTTATQSAPPDPVPAAATEGEENDA